MREKKAGATCENMAGTSHPRTPACAPSVLGGDSYKAINITENVLFSSQNLMKMITKDIPYIIDYNP